ncbi:anaerobic ribonucleoside-triphosphate reductase-activating protein [Vibrio phage vB_VcorM_GR7B]|nr:anaerobic ribonucleoside-triphosphate reductase-activating protein [Vibrio phage vB_VcorM_GR7B]
MLELSDVRVDGLTLSGGDPLYRRNRETILNLVKRVKHELPDKNIWMWSGYTHQQIMDDPTMAEILSYVDVLVDGKFELENKTAKLPWRGSSNQNLIYLEKA